MAISLKAARVKAGFSKKEAAAKLQISNKTLCGWKKGRRFPTQPELEKMLRLYGVSYYDIAFPAASQKTGNMEEV